MTDVVSLLRATVGIATFFRELGNSFYDASAEWRNFPENVNQLTEKQKYWEELVKENGLNGDKQLEGLLRKAEEQLKKEQEKVKQRLGEKRLDQNVDQKLKQKNNFMRKLAKSKVIVKGTLFPSEIARSIKEVIEKFDDIPKILKERQDQRLTVQREASNRNPQLGFNEDERYVRLEKTELAIWEALTQSRGPKLVLLHGKSGQGKSSLARNVALQIKSRKKQNAENQPVSSCPPQPSPSSVESAPSTSTSDDRPREIHEIFTEVIFLDCDPGTDSPSNQVVLKQRELRRKLGGLVELSKDEASFIIDLQESLSGLLQNRKLLIILDDVVMYDLVLEMLKRARDAPNVKFLVTSQNPRLLDSSGDSFDHKAIAMEMVSMIDARKVLAHHIYGGNPIIPRIPENIQECVDEIIESVERNLLAIACVGGAVRFDGKAFQDVKRWKDVKEYLEGYLDEQIPPFQDTKPRKYRAGLELSFDRLDEHERRLLFLIVLCRQPSVPQPVVQYLYRFVQDDVHRSFAATIRKLEGRQLVQTREKSCSVHSLLRSLLKEKFGHNYKDCIRDAMSNNKDIIGSIEERDTVSAISNVYFEDSDFAADIAVKVKSRAFHCSVDKNTLVVMARVMEPMLLFAVEKLEDDRALIMQSSSRQVLLNYVYERRLDEDGLTFLLREVLSRKCIDRGFYLRLADDGITFLLREAFSTRCIDRGLYLSMADKIMAMRNIIVAGEEDPRQVLLLWCTVLWVIFTVFSPHIFTAFAGAY